MYLDRIFLSCSPLYTRVHLVVRAILFFGLVLATYFLTYTLEYHADNQSVTYVAPVLSSICGK